MTIEDAQQQEGIQLIDCVDTTADVDVEVASTSSSSSSSSSSPKYSAQDAMMQLRQRLKARLEENNQLQIRVELLEQSVLLHDELVNERCHVLEDSLFAKEQEFADREEQFHQLETYIERKEQAWYTTTEQ